jgi:hypothetical protein
MRANRTAGVRGRLSRLTSRVYVAASYDVPVPESKRRKNTKPAYTPPPTTAARNRPPSPPWYGAVILVLFLLAVAWIVAYTLGPVPGQGALGGWNYVVALGLVGGAMTMLTNWR